MTRRRTVRDRLPPRVELDLSGVTFLDAYALAVLHLAVRSARSSRSLALRNPSRAAPRQPRGLTAGRLSGPDSTR